MTKPLQDLYIHFLDYYHYRRASHDNFATAQMIRKEAYLATRLSLLCAERVILPVSSFFENTLCRDIVRDHGAFRDAGVIKVSARDANINEHVESKKGAYDAHSPDGLPKAYHKRLRGAPGYLQKQTSSTATIRSGWYRALEGQDVRKIVDPYERLNLPNNFEKMWFDLPEMLEGRAFVPGHAVKELERSGIKLSNVSGINSVIEPLYINGYVEDFQSSIVRDLPTLSSSFDGKIISKESLSYATCVHKLTDLKLMLIIEEANQEYLFNVRCSSDWDHVARYLVGLTDIDAHIRDISERIIASFIKSNSSRKPPPKEEEVLLPIFVHQPALPSQPLALSGQSAAYRPRLDDASIASDVTKTSRHPVMIESSEEIAAVVICAVAREYEAAKNYFPLVKAAGGIREAYQSVIEPTGARIIVMKLRTMGNTEAALATQEAIRTWKPRFILLAGIAGGYAASNRMLGDILVADQIIAYEAAKVTDIGVELRPQAYRPSITLASAAQELAGEPARWVYSIREQRPDGSTGRTNPFVHVGAVLSGEKVVASDVFLKDFREIWTNAIGVEMEGAGSSLAVYTSESQPEFLLVKGICDWADSTKNDGWQPYAANAAMAFVRELLRSAVERIVGPAVVPKLTDYAKGLGVQKNNCSPTEKMEICQRMYGSWQELAELFEIPTQQQVRFRAGMEAYDLWAWLAERRMLEQLPSRLSVIGRNDIVNDFPCLQ